MIGRWLMVMMMMNYNNTLLRLNKEWKMNCLVVSLYYVYLCRVLLVMLYLYIVLI